MPSLQITRATLKRQARSALLRVWTRGLEFAVSLRTETAQKLGRLTTQLSRRGSVARFFFNVVEQGKAYADTEGSDLENVGIAREEALVIIDELARNRISDTDNRISVVEVVDEAREPVLTVTSTLVVAHSGRTD